MNKKANPTNALIGGRVGNAASVKRLVVAAAAPAKKSWMPSVKTSGNFVGPEWRDGPLRGNYGFDPLDLGTDPSCIEHEVEPVHGG